MAGGGAVSLACCGAEVPGASAGGLVWLGGSGVSPAGDGAVPVAGGGISLGFLPLLGGAGPNAGVTFAGSDNAGQLLPVYHFCQSNICQLLQMPVLNHMPVTICRLLQMPV